MAKSPNLKVGLVFDDSLDSNDGVAQYVKTIGVWLASQGHEVRYLVGQTKLTQWAGGKVYSLARNQTVNFNGNKLSIPWPAAKQPIEQVLAEERFDVLHIMTPYSPFMAQKIIKTAGSNVAIVGTFHIFPSGWLSKFGSRLLRIMYGRSLRRFDAMVSVSSAAAVFARSAFGLKTSVVPNPVDIGRFAKPKKLPADSGEQNIVFLGRLVKRKGCQQLLTAFSILSRRLPNVSLTIAGDGSARGRLERQAKHLAIAGKVNFVGYIDEKAKPELLAGADVACFPSLYGESFGIVLIEAMSAGAGVVLAGDNPGYRSVLGDQPRLLVNPRHKQVFADRLEELLTNQPIIDGLHNWQVSEVKQYDINVVGKQIIDVYRTAIARRAKNSNNSAHESKSDS